MYTHFHDLENIVDLVLDVWAHIFHDSGINMVQRSELIHLSVNRHISALNAYDASRAYLYDLVVFVLPLLLC